METTIMTTTESIIMTTTITKIITVVSTTLFNNMAILMLWLAGVIWGVAVKTETCK